MNRELTTLEKELIETRNKSVKPMLWISMVSMTMMFAGLISAYVISSQREDWVSFSIPEPFITSTVLLLISSITMYLASFFCRKNKFGRVIFFLSVTFFLAIGFMIFQFNGFKALKDSGFFFTGPTSLISSSMMIVIVFIHLLHIGVAIIVLTVILLNQVRGKYNSENMLGLELGEIFWHFLDVLWMVLFLFFYSNS